MSYVYLLVSMAKPDQHYVGFTRDLRKRVDDHNTGGQGYRKVGSMDVDSLLRVRRTRHGGCIRVLLEIRFRQSFS